MNLYNTEQEELEFYRNIMNNMGGCIYILNHEPYRLEWITNNNTTLRALGIDQKTAIEKGGEIPLWLSRDPDFKESVADALKAFEVDPNRRWGGIYRLTNFVQEEKWIAYSVAPLIMNSGGAVTKYVVCAFLVEDLMDTIITMKDFQTFLSKETHRDILNDLTGRQKEVLIKIGRGLSVKKIASDLNLSTHTIEDHKKSLFKKLNCKSQMELVRFAEKFGVI